MRGCCRWGMCMPGLAGPQQPGPARHSTGAPPPHPCPSSHCCAALSTQAYHVVNGTVAKAADLKDQERLETLLPGKTLKVRIVWRLAMEAASPGNHRMAGGAWSV